MRVLRHACPPPALRFSARPEGNPGIQQPHGPSLRSAPKGAGATRRAAPGRAQRWPEWTSNPLWLRLRRGVCGVGMRVGARMLRELTRRGCLNGAAQQRSEFHGAPRKRTGAGLPRRGRRLGVAFFCLLFLARQEKKVPRRGHIPASALNQGTQTTIKKIAASASHTTPNPSKHPHPSHPTNRKIHAPQQRLKQTPCIFIKTPQNAHPPSATSSAFNSKIATPPTHPLRDTQLASPRAPP